MIKRGEKRPAGPRDRKPEGRKDRENRDQRGYKENKERKEHKEQRENRDHKGFKERKDYKEHREYREQREYKPDLGLQENDSIEGEDRLEGRNPVLEALKSNRTINKIWVAKGDREGSIKQIVALARDRKIVVQEVERSKLDMMTTTGAHQGVIAFVAMKDYVEVNDIITAAREKGEAPFIIILDEITDPHNLGSILRTADAVGAHGVIIPKRRAVGLTSAVSKASAGAVEYVPVARVTNIAQTIELLKKENIWIVGTDMSGEKAFYEQDLKGAVALVVGSEGQGIGKLIQEKCDFVVNIPMKGKISSLNAAVAGAVVMYEIMKQRGR